MSAIETVCYETISNNDRLVTLIQDFVLLANQISDPFRVKL
jgi:hypothetical protein